MNKGLQKYENDDSVIAICGYRFFYNHIFDGNNYFCNQQDYNAWGLARWIKKQEAIDDNEDGVRQNNEEPSYQNIKLLEDLSIISKLSNEVINVLIDYVLIKQSGRLPYNYVMKIASSLSNAGIRTAEEAMSYFSNVTGRSKANQTK